jgi:hypothetical protein
VILTSKEPDHVVFDEGINILKIKTETMPTTTTTVQPVTTTTVQPTTTTTMEPTLIQLSSFTATRGLGKVILEWTTESELDNAGFNVLRAESDEGEYVKINAALIPAKGSLTQGASYAFVDSGVRAWKPYWYKIEDLDLAGNSTMHGPVKVSPRLIFGILQEMMR